MYVQRADSDGKSNLAPLTLAAAIAKGRRLRLARSSSNLKAMDVNVTVQMPVTRAQASPGKGSVDSAPIATSCWGDP
eukprot:3149216-Lingulodinium_polyedra.AAC.1